MARTPYKERLMVTEPTNGTAAQPPCTSTPAPDRRAQVNARIRAAAHKWLDKYCADAETEQIDGRMFYGHVVLDIPYVNGTAQEVKASKSATDRP
jgi:hypothetical protein